MYETAIVRGKAFFTAAMYHRRYTAKELRSAELLSFRIRRHLETSGEEHDTDYDGAAACIYCGAGREQKSVLRLDLRRISQSADIVETLGGEVVISSRLAELIRRHGITGVRLNSVEDSRRNGISAEWYQLMPVGRRVEINGRTRAGIDPFDPDVEGRFRCPRGHVLGLNLLSEVWLERDSWNGDDVVVSRQMFGDVRGLLRPQPIWFMSQRFWRVLTDAGVARFAVEVSHLI